MAYDNEKLNFGKEHIYIVDLLLTGCFQTAGVGACGATETGDEKCFNTIETCNFTDPGTEALLAITSVTNSKNFLRFYQSRSPAPIGLVGSTISGIDPIPCLKSVSIAPTKIDLSGGLGVRASVSCTFTDFPHSDISIDKYLDERTYIASDRGTFWTKLRARNPDYQNKELRVLSGFLVDGVFDINNFKTRYYIVDKMTVSNGMCTIVAKDPLKLTSSKKAQAPKASIGQLLGDIAFNAATAVLIPAGIGSNTDEYPLSGKILINSEVIGFSRSAGSDTLQLDDRGENNTIPADHSADDTIQLCLEYVGKQVDFIVKNLLEDFAGIDSSFIPSGTWSAEVNSWLNGGLSAIIVKPFDVFKLLKELAESKPHYLWWDENLQTIQLTALKGPNSSGDVIDMDSGIVENSFKTSDKPELRKSTIFVNFGQFDPTKRLDEFSNYQQSYVRVDTESISKYGSNEIKTINSRWISSGNKGAAKDLAALIGRRFSDIPREISFSLEVKDSDIWVGQNVIVNHRDVVDFTGLPVDTVYQILSSKDSGNIDHSCLEFTYGDELDQDDGAGTPDFDPVYIPNGVDGLDYNMLIEYEKNFPSPDEFTKVVFFVEAGVTVGATSNSLYSIDTGTWPAGAEITLQINNGGFVVGKGGDGGASTTGDDGGHAIILNHNLTILNNGVIGGGGGGGGSANNIFGGSSQAGGGGGAGNLIGAIGATFTNVTNTYTINPSSGTTSSGGDGGQVLLITNDSQQAVGGNGGDLGLPGDDALVGVILTAGGAAGDAINKNSKTLTIDPTSTGVILGNQVG